MFPLVMLVVNVSSVAVIWFGGHRVDDGQMQVGALTAFLCYLMQILMSVMMGTFMLMQIPRSAVCADRIGEVLDTDPSVLPPTCRRHRAAPGTASWRWSDVAFTYPGAEQPVLLRRHLQARPGQTVAIIGSTGAGKSTLVNLVPRLFDATAGTVRVDGVDVRDLDPEVLWSRIGLVPQQAFLFTGTVRSNLLHGKPDATDDELWQALEVAQARDFVERMPEGLDAPIVQGGTNVSGGQRQRLAIARALVRRPRSTSSTTRSPRSTWPPTPGCARRCGRDPRRHRPRGRPAGLHHPRRRPDPGAGGRPGRRPRHPRRAARHNETYQEIVASQLTAEEARMTTTAPRPPGARPQGRARR